MPLYNPPPSATGDIVADSVTVEDVAYDATSWNGSFEVPTKNAVRDKIESISAGTLADDTYGEVTVSASGTVWTVDSLAILSNVNNTSDAAKPVSTATQTALDLKAGTTHTHAQSDVTDLVDDLTAFASAIDGKQPLDSDLTTIAGLTATTDNFMVSASSAWASRTPAQAKTALALAKGDVGLGSVDNTSDASKPVSTLTQTALDAKQPLDSDLTTLAGLTATTDNFIVSASSAWASRTPTQAKTSLALVKADVGLGSVDNTSDASKPVSTATQTALDLKQTADADLTTIAGLTATTDNFLVSVSSAWASRTPTQAKTTLALVKADVGLSNVDNTTDAGKPVSTATQTALDLKANLTTKLDDFGTPDDNTDLNASITAHGLLKKLPNDDSLFLDGLGNWVAPTAEAAISAPFVGDQEPGSFTIATAKFGILFARLTLTTTQRATLTGTARLGVLG